MSQSNLSGPLNITDALIVGGTAHFTGAATFSGGQAVTGNVTATGNVAFTGGTLTFGTNVWVYGTAAPAAGTWHAGDIVWDRSPEAEGPVGWSCTTGGTTGGTWKAFGTLAA